MKIVGEPIADYHKNSAISHSKLNSFMEVTGGSPLRFYQRHVANMMPSETGEHFDIGQAFHLMMEDTAKYQASVVDAKFDAYRTNEAKAWREQQLAAGKIILSKEQSDALSAMHGRVLDHKLLQRLIVDTEAEVTWRKDFGKYAVQCRTDRYKPGLIVDWKTVCSIADFERDVVAHGYHTQAEFYRLTIAACLGLSDEEAQQQQVIFVAVEKQPPFEVQPFELDPDSLRVARSEIILALKHLKWCFEHNQWKRSERIQTVRLKRWFVAQAEERLLELRDRLQSAEDSHKLIGE